MKITDITAVENRGLTVLEKIIKNRDISSDQLQKLFNPIEEIFEPDGFFKLDEAAAKFDEYYKSNKKIGYLVDVDMDGISASASLARSFSGLIPIFHQTKTHGLTDADVLEYIKSLNLDMLIIPDAGSSDKKQILEICDDTYVIVLDHHPFSEWIDDIFLLNEIGRKYTICNSQHPHNLNGDPELTGVGMVYVFVKLLKDKYGYDIDLDNIVELFAIGQIGDASDISKNSIRNIVVKGLNRVASEDGNPFIKVIAKDVLAERGQVCPRDLSFSIIPLVNAVCRIGTLKEKKLLFKALSCDPEMYEETILEKRRKNKETGKFDKVQIMFTGFEIAADELKKVKASQNKIVKSQMEELFKEGNKGLYNGPIAIAVIPALEDGSISGLIAQKVCSALEKPAIVVTEGNNGDRLFGSARSAPKYLESFKQWCTKTGKFCLTEGHDNAFGVGFEKSNYDAIKMYAEMNLEKSDPTYKVDHIYDILNGAELLELALFGEKLGGSLSKIELGFNGIMMPKSYIRQRGKMLSLWNFGVTFKSFDAPEWLEKEMTRTSSPFLKFDIVGEISVDSYKGKLSPTIFIKDIEIHDDEKDKIEEEEFIF